MPRTSWPRTLPFVVLCALAMCAAAGAAAPGSDEGEQAYAYYTAAQAQRGEALFNQHCLLCHGGPALDGVTWPTGYRVADQPPRKLGNGFRQLNRDKYPSVYYLFGRIRDSMPAWGAETVSLQDKASIVAYLLNVNGYPAGPRELTPDIPRMKTMWLTEPGFTSLFNGLDFTGWKFNIGLNCKPAPLGCGKTEPGKTFRVEQGAIVVDGKRYGYAYTEKAYRDFTLRLQVRWVPPSDWNGVEDRVKYWGDGGIYLFITDHSVYPNALQMQLTVEAALQPTRADLKKTGITYNQAALQGAMRPLGTWNDVEIVSKGGVVTGALNGVELGTIRDLPFTEGGQIGVQSEGSEMHFRNIRIKPE